MSLSAWLAQAAEAKLRQDGDDRILEQAAQERRSEALRAYLDEWQAEHGPSPRRRWRVHGGSAN